MTLRDFFRTMTTSIETPIFKTTRDLTVETFVWVAGCSPTQQPKTFIIPEGTEILYSGYSNFGDGHSVRPANPRQILGGKNASLRWFRCNYSDMEISS